MHDRQTYIEHLAAALRRATVVRAAWLGGSDATGRTDVYSDIDLFCVVEDDHVEEAFDLVERALVARSPIEHAWRVPEPTWHGHSQKFYRLRDAGPWLMIDFCVQKKSCDLTARLLEPQRHGEAVILFDHDGLLADLHRLGECSHAEKAAAHIEQLRIRVPLLQPLVEKAVLRSSLVEAMYFYQAFAMRPLIDLLRCMYCPERYDFGWRYLQSDLPAEWYEKLERLAFPRDADDLIAKHREAVALFDELMKACTSGESGQSSG